MSERPGTRAEGEGVAGENNIQCPKCGRRVVPRLGHYGGGPLTYVKVQHLCPFCGVAMYESGGGVRWGCLIPLVLIPLAVGWLFILITLLQLRH